MATYPMMKPSSARLMIISARKTVELSLLWSSLEEILLVFAGGSESATAGPRPYWLPYGVCGAAIASEGECGGIYIFAIRKQMDQSTVAVIVVHQLSGGACGVGRYISIGTSTQQDRCVIVGEMRSCGLQRQKDAFM